MLAGILMKLKAFISRWINQMNLRKRILVLYLFVVVIPIILLGLGAEKIMFNFLKSDYSVSVYEAVDQVAKNVEFRKLTYELLATRTSMDGELAARLSRAYTDFYEQWETITFIDRSYGNIRESLPGMEYFRIYHTNTTLVEDGGIIWKPDNRFLAGMSENEWFEKIKTSRAAMAWDLYRDPQNGLLYMTLSRKISWITGESMAGAIILNVRSSQLFKNLFDTSFRGQGDVFLLNEEGVIFSSSREDLIGKNIHQSPYKAISQMSSDSDAVMELEGHKNIVVSKNVSSGWRVAAAVPLKNLESRTRSLSIWIIGITLSLVLLSAILMLMVINNIVFRLKDLENKMMSVTKGRFNVVVRRGSADELGDLEERFNLMAGKLGDLTNEIARVRTLEREEALKALQAQINPHFLYNTLGIIRWRALDLNDTELCRLVDAMTVFYRLSLNKGNSLLRIRDEIEHIRAFIVIQQFRYMDNVSVTWDIEESVLDLYTIKLILQPIIENSYMHGMVAKKGNGILAVSVMRKDDSVIFRIQDNGIGMPEKTAAMLLNKSVKSNSSGYGLVNIRERLRLYFGERGKIFINSEQEKGTTVSIVIPVCAEPPVLKEADTNVESIDC